MIGERMQRRAPHAKFNHVGRVRRIKLAAGMAFAAHGACFPLDSRKETRQLWVDNHDLFMGDNGRVYALVDTATSVYFMDAVTGSLYNFGQCLTSTKTRSSFVRDARCAERLMSLTRVEQSGWDSNNEEAR